MIASCWDWPSLKYAYYILEGEDLDAGGWSPSRGIVSSVKAVNSDSSVSFDDCLPTLPKECYFAGVGDFCIGELFSKKDAEERPRIDMSRMRTEGSPSEVKLVELIEGSSTSPVGSLRGAVMDSRENPEDPPGSSAKKELYPSERNVWEKATPYLTSIGFGYAMYRLFESNAQADLTLKNTLFAWGTGVALGVTLGQEMMRQALIRNQE
jgi:hypothetical protein